MNDKIIYQDIETLEPTDDDIISATKRLAEDIGKRMDEQFKEFVLDCFFKALREMPPFKKNLALMLCEPDEFTTEMFDECIRLALKEVEKEVEKTVFGKKPSEEGDE